MGQARDKIDMLKGMVTQARANGSISSQVANAFWDIVGDRPAAPSRPVDREVVIRLRVSGPALPAGAEREVERALVGLAARAGQRVTPGSVRVS